MTPLVKVRFQSTIKRSYKRAPDTCLQTKRECYLLIYLEEVIFEPEFLARSEKNKDFAIASIQTTIVEN